MSDRSLSGTVVSADRGYGCLEKPFKGSELRAKVGSLMQMSASAGTLAIGSREQS